MYPFGVAFKVFLVRFIVADIIIQTLSRRMESLHTSSGCLLAFYSLKIYTLHNPWMAGCCDDGEMEVVAYVLLRQMVLE